MKLNFLLIAVIFSLPSLAQVRKTPTAYTSSRPVNFSRIWEAVGPDTSAADINIQAPLRLFKTTTQYADGLGRNVQTVVKQGSQLTGSAFADLVTPDVYDEFNREQFKYLSFAANNAGGNASITDGLFKLNPFQQDSVFCKQQYPGEDYYYSQTGYELSPMNRVFSEAAPGNSWVGNGNSKKMKYFFNATADSVRIWAVTDVANDLGNYSSTAIYSAGMLFKTIDMDEQGQQVIEFKDKEGNVILKKVQLTASADTGLGKGHYGWLNTYYIYDDLNNLRCVVQPKAVEMLMSNSWTMTSNILNELCFRYCYDQQRRMTMKKNPGAGIAYIVFDMRDRPVMTQDSLTRARHQWLYTLYDGLNRKLVTGLITDNTNYNNATYHWQHADSSIAWPNVTSYTNEELTRVFYDDYSWRSQYSNPLTATYNTSYDSYMLAGSTTTWPYPRANNQSIQTRGLVTGGRNKVIGTSSTYLYNVEIYDDKERAIQMQALNISGGTDIHTEQFCWLGPELITVEKSEKGGTNAQTIVSVTQSVYDSLWRTIQVDNKVSHSQINGGAMPGSWHTLYQNAYDKLGQHAKMVLAPAFNGGPGLDSLLYEYNIRGWTLGMNRNFIKDAEAHYFGFELGYDKTANIMTGSSYNQAQYNGDIAGATWRSKGDGEVRKYDFKYDATNRLLRADFSQYTGGSFNKNANIDFSTKIGDGVNPPSAYDANGNILSMTQHGLKMNTSPVIDSLVYGYNSGGNRLDYVTDLANDSSSTFGDFKEFVNNSTQDYLYDGNGNLIMDKNKRINSITYNYLNLPATIAVTGKGMITYTYDAAGIKLQKTVVDSTVTPVVTTTTLYGSGVVFQNDTLLYIVHDNGRVRKKDSVTLVYDHFIKDHLGDIRMVLTEEQELDVYTTATFEDAATSNEQLYYLNAGVQRTARPGPFNSSATNGDKVQLLQKSTQPMGAGKLLKVMSGDRIHVKVDYYIPSATTDNSTANGLSDILANLLSVLNGPSAPAALHGSGSVITTGLNANTSFTSFLSPEGTGTTSSLPKAYLNILFFDNQFNFVAQNSEIVQVSTEGSGQQILRISGSAKQAPRNGYVYVFVSNESNNLVYFDNLQVTHERSPLLEETHYYAFGLTMAGISDRALKFQYAQNKYRFNGKELQNQEFSDGSGLESYDMSSRYYDPQLGRWSVMDAHASTYGNYSPYIFVGNNPLILVDPDGKDWFFYSSDGVQDGTWHWHEGSQHTIQDKDNNDIVLQGVAAVVEFDGSEQEHLDENGKLNTSGASVARVTVYGPGGADDIHVYKGYTMSSNPEKYGVVKDGTYEGNYRDPGKSGSLHSNWAVNDAGQVPDMRDLDPLTKLPYLTGVYIHRSNNNGFAGEYEKKGKDGKMETSAISKGCLLINPKYWDDFNKVMDGVKKFKVVVDREKLHVEAIKNALFMEKIERDYINFTFGRPNYVEKL